MPRTMVGVRAQGSPPRCPAPVGGAGGPAAPRCTLVLPPGRMDKLSVRNRPEGWLGAGIEGDPGEPRAGLPTAPQQVHWAVSPATSGGQKLPIHSRCGTEKCPGPAFLGRHLRHRGAPDPRCEENKAGKPLVAQGNHSENTSLVSFLFSYRCPYWLNSQSTYLLLKEFYPKRCHRGHLPLMTCTEVVQQLGERMRSPLPSELSRPPKRLPAHGPYRKHKATASSVASCHQS